VVAVGSYSELEVGIEFVLGVETKAGNIGNRPCRNYWVVRIVAGSIGLNRFAGTLVLEFADHKLVLQGSWAVECYSHNYFAFDKIELVRLTNAGIERRANDAELVAEDNRIEVHERT